MDNDTKKDNILTEEQLERYNVTNIVAGKKSRGILKSLIVVIIMFIIGIIVLLIKGSFYLTEFKEICADISDFFLYPGIIMICVTGLVMCSNEGAFDMLVYGVQTAVITMFKRNPKDRKYENFGDYRIAKAQRKTSIIHLLIPSIISILIGIIFFIVYKSL